MISNNRVVRSFGVVNKHLEFKVTLHTLLEVDVSHDESFILLEDEWLFVGGGDLAGQWFCDVYGGVHVVVWNRVHCTVRVSSVVLQGKDREMLLIAFY